MHWVQVLKPNSGYISYWTAWFKKRGVQTKLSEMPKGGKALHRAMDDSEWLDFMAIREVAIPRDVDAFAETAENGAVRAS